MSLWDEFERPWRCSSRSASPSVCQHVNCLNSFVLRHKEKSFRIVAQWCVCVCDVAYKANPSYTHWRDIFVADTHTDTRARALLSGFVLKTNKQHQRTTEYDSKSPFIRYNSIKMNERNANAHVNGIEFLVSFLSSGTQQTSDFYGANLWANVSSSSIGANLMHRNT